jgi:hypothetical protein
MPNEEMRRRRNVYDYNGEYEFVTVQHWTSPDIEDPWHDARFSNRPGVKGDFHFSE